MVDFVVSYFVYRDDPFEPFDREPYRPRDPYERDPYERDPFRPPIRRFDDPYER